ncbi:hypothetical protein ABTM70_18915, partial [Acinetobacter baumannii]
IPRRKTWQNIPSWLSVGNAIFSGVYNLSRIEIARPDAHFLPYWRGILVATGKLGKPLRF